MARPDYTNLDLVIPSVSEIVPGLFQGMRPGTYRTYDLVVSCELHLAKGPMESFRGMVIHVPMMDDDDWPINDRLILIAANAVVDVVNSGGRVLVHCTGGLNRSSVVTAMAIVELGLTRKEAVRHLRLAHNSACLCNRAFERWVLDEVLPTAETSAFRVS